MGGVNSASGGSWGKGRMKQAKSSPPASDGFQKVAAVAPMPGMSELISGK